MAKCRTPGCARKGTGPSGLCSVCFEDDLYGDELDEEETLLTRVLEHPIAQSLWQRGIDALGGKFDEITGRLDKFALAFIASQQQRQQQQAAQPPKEDPRIIMGFTPDEKLDEKKIRKRRKDLLQLYHEDKLGEGGRVMSQKINLAADDLLRSL